MFRVGTAMPKAHDDAIWSVAWPSADVILTGGLDETVRFHTRHDDAYQLAATQRPHSLAVVCVAAAAAAPVYASCALDGVIALYNAAFEVSSTISSTKPGEAFTVSVSDTGASLVSAGVGGHVAQRSTATASVDWRTQLDRVAMVHTVCYGPASVSVGAGTSSGALVFVKASTGAESARVDCHSGVVRCMAFADDAVVVSGGDDTVARLSDTRSSANVCELRGHVAAVHGVAVSPASPHLVVTASADRTVKVFDTRTQEILHSFGEHAEAVNGVAFRPDTADLVSVSNDASMRFFSVSEK